MKIVVVSDSHGALEVLRDIEQAHPDADIFLHLGDSCLAEAYLGRFISVKGNADYFTDYPLFRIIDTPFGKIYAEHGHIHSKLSFKSICISRGCKIFMSGHTHRHEVVIEDGLYYFNPGSTSRPRDDTNGTYLILNISNDKIEYEFIEL